MTTTSYQYSGFKGLNMLTYSERNRKEIKVIQQSEFGQEGIKSPLSIFQSVLLVHQR